MPVTNEQIATQMSALLDKWTLREQQMTAWLAGTATGGPNNDGRYPISDWYGNVLLVESPAKMAANVTNTVNGASAFANNASTSATNAANSASSASTSANTATTKASDASQAAATAVSAKLAAEGAEANASAAFKSLDNRYLGAKTTDPTTDNYGQTLLTGAIYFNTTTNIMKVWTGTTWVNF